MAYIVGSSAIQRSGNRNNKIYKNTNRFNPVVVNTTKKEAVRHYKDYSKATKLYVKPFDLSDTWYYECLVLESGAVIVGTDVFRLLQNDICSHPVKAFPNIEEVTKKYRIIERTCY